MNYLYFQYLILFDCLFDLFQLIETVLLKSTHFELIGNSLHRVHPFKRNGYRLIDIRLELKAKFTTFKSISASRNNLYISQPKCYSQDTRCKTLLRLDSNIVHCKSYFWNIICLCEYLRGVLMWQALMIMNLVFTLIESSLYLKVNFDLLNLPFWQ